MKKRITTMFKKIYENLAYNLKLKYKLIAAFSVFIVIPILLLGLSSHYLMQKSLEDAERKSLIQSMTQLNNAIDYFFESYMNASAMLFSNYDLQQALVRDVDTIEDVANTKSSVDKIVNQLSSSFSFPEIKNYYYSGAVTSIQLYVKNEKLAEYGGNLSSFNEIKDEEWCRKLYESKLSYSWQSDVLNNDIQYIALNRKLIDFNTSQNIGVMRIYILKAKIKSIIENNVTNSQYKFFYIDQDMKSIASIGVTAADDSLLNKLKQLHSNVGANDVKVDREKYIVGTVVSNVTGWRLIYATPTDIITVKTRNVSAITFVSITIALILCIIISVIISSFVTRRINVLVKKTNQVDKDNFSVKVKIKGNDEIGQLDRNFNGMLERINNLIENEYKSKITISKTRLELLQEQINPHMLYNTLSMISMISRDSGREDILNVTNSLIGFYKGILNRGKIVCSLREEFNMVKMYIEIMKFVYRIDIDCILEIDDSINEYYSIKLLLQPIVENAIVHGLRPKNGGMLFISARETDMGIELVVSDNGTGMSEEVKDYLNSILERDELDKSYGLGNVIKRINLFFGASYGVSIDSSPISGTTVSMTMPKLTEKEIKLLLESRYLV